MRLPYLLFSSLLLTPISALPGPAPIPAAEHTIRSEDISWSITNYHAFINPNSTNPTPSVAMFRFNESTPNSAKTLDCLVTQPIYRDIFSMCGPKGDLLYKISEGQMILRRTFTASSGQRLTGIATQGTYWKGGEAGNVSEVQTGGKIYTQTMPDWAFPIDSLVA